MAMRIRHSSARRNYDAFVRGYIDAALFSSTDESDDGGGESMDANYSRSDIASSSLKSIKRECARFIKKHKADLEEFVAASPRGSHEDGGWALAGHCFWLNRNGHGTGFWDRDAGDVGDRLSAASEKAGESDMYVGDNGEVHVSPER